MTTTNAPVQKLDYARPDVYPRLKQLTGRLAIVFAISAGLSVITVFLIAFGMVSPPGELEAVFGLLSNANGLVGIVLIVGFMMWCFRAGKSAEVLTRTKLNHSPSSAVWWWFVPVANLFKPFAALREIAQPADADLSAFEKAKRLVGPVQGLFVGYVLLAIAGVVAMFNLLLSLPMDQLDQVDHAVLPNLLLIGANLSWAGCCVMLILFTRQTTDAHELLT
ncbi:MAG: DUF4328 domain-containing protein [Planctomycetota bacterium]